MSLDGVTVADVVLGISLIAAIATNTVYVTRWGTRIETKVDHHGRLQDQMEERLGLHEAQSQHGPDRYVSEQICTTVHNADRKLTEQRFAALDGRLERIEVTLAKWTDSQAQAMSNMIEITSKLNEWHQQELQRRRTEHG